MEVKLNPTQSPPRLFMVNRVKKRRNFSLVACYSLKLTRCSLLVVKSLVTRCKIRSLLVTKNHSLLVAKLVRYLLQKLRIAKNLFIVKKHSLLVAKFDRYLLHKVTKKSLCYGRRNLDKFESILLNDLYKSKSCAATLQSCKIFYSYVRNSKRKQPSDVL